MLLLFLSPIQNSNAQAISKIDLEKQVKTSGKFYWQQYITFDTIQGKQKALDLLLSTDEIKTILTNNGNNRKDSVKYLNKIWGDKFCVISYVRKDVINAKHNIPIVTESVNLNKVAKIDVAQKNVLKLTEEQHPITYKSGVSSNKSISESDFLNKLSTFTNYTSALKYLNEQKNNGKIIYSLRSDAFNEGISQCYILGYENTSEEIVFLLDKGDENRTNILTSEQLSLEALKKLTNNQKIYIYEFK
jgi:hypothetical protein